MRNLLYILIALTLSTNLTSCTPDSLEDAVPPVTEKFSGRDGRDGMDGASGSRRIDGDNEGSGGDPG